MLSSMLRRTLFEPLYYLKNRSPLLGYWKRLEETQWFGLAELEEIQWKRLQKLYSFLWKHNRFYRARFQDVGLHEKGLQSPEDIQKIPILTKKEIRDNVDAMISEGYHKKNLLHFKTGGSTGKALDIFVTEECSELRNACARRHDRWTGWEVGDPIGAAWGNPHLPKTIKEKILHYCLHPYIYLDTMEVTPKSVQKFANRWHKVQPTLLYGHAHSLFLLAQHVQNLSIDTICPRGILSTSMMLLPHERKVIEQVFNCRVTDRYGCEEVSLVGSECERHDGMHMNIEHLVIEFIKDDGTVAEPGELGDIVVTDLMNYAMPFVRYKVEDVGTPLNKQCACGRGLPLMGKVAGRVADFLIKKDGTKVAGVSIIENTLTKIPGIDQMQIIQQSLDAVTLNVVPGTAYTEFAQSFLVDYFREIFPETIIVVQKVKEIRPEPSGKYRFSICHVKEE